MSKYTGAWHPGMGAGDDDESSSASSRSGNGAHAEGHQNNFDWGKHYEERARERSYGKMHAPRVRWEQYGKWRVLAVEFPASDHYVWVSEHPHELGRVIAYCEGCHDDGCAACRWARAMYFAERKRERARGAPDDGRLPF